MSAIIVMNMRDIFTRIMEFLSEKELRIICKSFRNSIHYNYINLTLTSHMLLFGEVQSGKTHKIIHFIKFYEQSILKIILIQNSKMMLQQMGCALISNGIKYKTIHKNNATHSYNGERVLLTIQNKFRLKALTTYLKHNKLKWYCLVMDESDQYYKRLQNTKLIKSALSILHVTATPQIYHKIYTPFDKIIKIQPQHNYVGIDKVNIQHIMVEKGKILVETKIEKTLNIVMSYFINKPNGMMLINCFTKIRDMMLIGMLLSKKHIDIPVVVLSTKMVIWKRGVEYGFKIKTIQKLIDSLKRNNHIIFIANRYSNRGINYTDSLYERTLTHQISCQSGSSINFIQKCRIFGNRNISTLSYIPTLYCLSSSDNFINVKIKEQIKNVENIIRDEPDNYTLTLNNMLVKNLIKLCKDNGIRGYSGKKKLDLIELIKNSGFILPAD